MLFNSYIFIFVFMPLCIAGFYSLASHNDGGRAAKVWLIGFSLWFYGYFSLSYLLIMIASVVINYGVAFLLSRERKKAYLITGVVLNLGLLFWFKYLDFMIGNINTLFGSDIPLKHILLPLGISFFTFQQIGYLADIYRGDECTVSFIDHALFVCFFPQLVAGPIVSASEMLPQFETIEGRRPDPEKIGRGLTLFILGLAKKVLLADALGRAVDIGYADVTVLGGLDSFLVMIWYALQLYLDFSGYCNMACGLAAMLGFDLPENFDSPYKSCSIVEFWRRWHKTLTRFFTRYVYIPLGGNRRGAVRTVVNILIVYFLSGLWHGAGWNFILWGMLHGAAFAIVRMISGKDKKVETSGIGSRIKNIAGTAVTFLYVSLAWIYFRADSIATGTRLIRNMFTGTWKSVNYYLADAFVQIDELWYIVKFTGLPGTHFALAHNLVMTVFTVAVLIMIFAAPKADDIAARIKPKPVTAVILGVLGLWCVLALSEVSTFLYFNF